RSAGEGVGIALLWRDGAPSPPPSLPPGVAVFDDGPRISRELGVGVAPFALSANAGGYIVRAAPVGSLDALVDLLAQADGGEQIEQPSLLHRPLKGVS
ncbi:MAG: hypothetical protein M3O70_15985, partial [Actinomycetota bacterium]|nr:hypothetical protein [Actinomycetota bacterium]